MTSPTGQQVSLEAGAYRAVVVQVGGGIRTLEYDGRPVVEGYPVDAMADAGRGQLLLPWPNRIEDGRYTFQGTDFQLDISEPSTGNAIHGLTRWMPWSVVEAGADRAVLRWRIWPRSGYPHLLDCEVRYTLDADQGLHVRVTASNFGMSPAPYAAGTHPYLSAGGGDHIDDWSLTVPAAEYIPLDERLLPIGREAVEGTPYDFRSPRVIGDTALDTCFTAITADSDGRASVTLQAPDGWTTSLWWGPGQPYVQLFTGDKLPPDRRRTGIAVEPMTAPANAFASGEGLVVLEPGQTHTVEWGIRGSSS